MGKVIDLTGQKFERLTVIRKLGSNKWGKKEWLCKCDCGNEIITITAHLRNGNTKSCGCLQKEIIGNRYRLNPGIAMMHNRLRQYQKRAERQGVKWNLTEEQFKEITQQPCYYCGAKPSNRVGKNYKNGVYICNGIDKINNTEGYTIDNVVPCCKTCNSAKGTLSLQEFKDWITKVYENMQ